MKKQDRVVAERHRASGSNSRFDGGQLPFTDYVARTREMIARSRGGAAADNLEAIVDGNAPFGLKPAPGFPPGQKKTYRRGVLLTHGLTDSPYFMRHLAALFQECGFRVMAVLLPGHGTQPGDLLDVTWQEWAKAVAYGTDRIAEEADEVYLAGFSAGGTLSIYQSLRDDRVRGLFLFSPALKISPRAARANLHKFYSWLLPSAKWVDIKPDGDSYKYESFPKNAAAQMHGLTRKVCGQLRQRGITIPAFVAASLDDTTVDARATLEFMARAAHPCSRMVLYATETDKLPLGIAAEKLELVNSGLPAQKILGSAHTAIVLPAEDGHYGTGGDYRNCIHYYPGDMGKYDACKGGAADVWQGEITEKNLKARTLRRLMFNPHFAMLKASIKRFIGGLG
ncbi:MAG: hypothetical protein FD134_2398 [Gallionellaceae bacterium]|nr:MAG: hypothetical protein FD134_2398 [Gallionellaceae bacterium]